MLHTIAALIQDLYNFRYFDHTAKTDEIGQVKIVTQ